MSDETRQSTVPPAPPSAASPPRSVPPSMAPPPMGIPPARQPYPPGPPAGPVAGWEPPRTETNRTLATVVVIVIGLVIVLPLLAIVTLIFLGGQVSQILSAVGNSI